MNKMKDLSFFARAARMLTSARRVAAVLLAVMLTMTAQTAWADDIDLEDVNSDITLNDGDAVWGSLDKNVSIFIADGAIVQFYNVNIKNRYASNPGITCLGDATIIFDGINEIHGGIRGAKRVGEGDEYTLTIQGNDGSELYVFGYDGAPIGSRHNGSCGNIVIESGTIIATIDMAADVGAAGIGTGTNGSCGNITISGGTVSANGDMGSAGIGCGEGSSMCGNITITSGIVSVTAQNRQLQEDFNSIGAGLSGTCGTVTINGMVNPVCGNPTTIIGHAGLAVDGDIPDGTAGHNYVNMPETGTTMLKLSDATVGTIKVYDDGGKNAPFSKDCKGTLVITAPDDYVINVTSNSIALKQTSDDYLKIYDNKAASGKLLGSVMGDSYDGSAIDYTSTGNHMTLHFESSDANNTAAGLDLTVTLTPIPWTGTGTEDDPYIISYPSQLDLLATNVNAGNSYNGKFFKLANDITYSHTTDWDDATSTENNYTAIGTISNPFKGTFDGDGHTISGIRIKSTSQCQGLFGAIDGTAVVKKVTLADARIAGANYTGGIVAKNSGYVDNCHVLTGVTITGTGTLSVSVGGVVGQNNLGAIVSYCTSAASIGISANSNIGGIAGSNAGSLTNNLAVGVRTTSATSTCNRGAIVGMNEDAGSIGSLGNNFYSGCAIGTLTSNVGCNSADVTVNNGAVPISDGYIVTVGSNVTADIFHKIYGEISPYYKYAADENVTLNAPSGYSITSASYNDGSDHEITVVNGVCGFIMPACNITVTATRSVIDWATANTGTKNDPYIIYNKDQLDLLATNVNSGTTYENMFFKLANDITYSHTTDWDAATSDENNYTAIGLYSGTTANCRYFCGHFDGQGHTISGIRIYSTETTKGFGLFGLIGSGAEVKGVILDDARIAGGGFSAGIVGRNEGGTIDGCQVTAKVAVVGTLPDANTKYLGGIVGYNGIYSPSDSDGSTVKKCTSSVTISYIGSEKNNYCGGIAGFNKRSVTDNFVIGANICEASSNHHGAIIGHNNSTGTAVQRNYYRDCTVAGVANAIDKGCENSNITANDGAMPVFTLTMGTGITTTTTATVTYSGTSYYVFGKAITLSGGLDNVGSFGPGYTAGYATTSGSVSGNATDGFILTMGYGDATVSASNRYPIDWAMESTGDDADHAYMIYNPEQLDLLAQRVNNGEGYAGKFFKLGANIAYAHKAANEEGADTENNYTAIGNSISVVHSFNGTFLGQNHVVSGIRIYKSGITNADDYQGLFGYVGSTGVISGVIVTDARIVGRNVLGVIAARVLEGGSLSHNYYYNCTAYGRTYDIGCSGADITDNDGAVSIHTLTLADGITAEPTPVFTISGTPYYSPGTTVTLSYNGTLPTGCIHDYIVNGTAISGNTFNMPAEDVTVTSNTIQCYTLTLADGITATPTPTITVGSTPYYRPGTTVALSYTGELSPGCVK